MEAANNLLQVGEFGANQFGGGRARQVLMTGVASGVYNESKESIEASLEQAGDVLC